MTRRFEFISGKSAKFWQTSIEDCTVIVMFGRIGVDGQQVTKSFDNQASAQKHADKMIGEKLRKGYLEVAIAQ